MSKIRLDFKTLKPLVDSASKNLAKGSKTALNLLKNRDFQKGALAIGIPSGISAFFLIRKYQKEVEEKERLYKEKLRKQNAVTKALESEVDITKERQDKLLRYDSKLKNDISSLETEIEELKKQIADLKKGESKGE